MKPTSNHGKKFTIRFHEQDKIQSRILDQFMSNAVRDPDYYLTLKANMERNHAFFYGDTTQEFLDSLQNRIKNKHPDLLQHALITIPHPIHPLPPQQYLHEYAGLSSIPLETLTTIRGTDEQFRCLETHLTINEDTPPPAPQNNIDTLDHLKLPARNQSSAHQIASLIYRSIYSIDPALSLTQKNLGILSSEFPPFINPLPNETLIHNTLQYILSRIDRFRKIEKKSFFHDNDDFKHLKKYAESNLSNPKQSIAESSDLQQYIHLLEWLDYKTLESVTLKLDRTNALLPVNANAAALYFIHSSTDAIRTDHELGIDHRLGKGITSPIFIEQKAHMFHWYNQTDNQLYASLVANLKGNGTKKGIVTLVHQEEETIIPNLSHNLLFPHLPPEKIPIPHREKKLLESLCETDTLTIPASASTVGRGTLIIDDAITRNLSEKEYLILRKGFNLRNKITEYLPEIILETEFLFFTTDFTSLRAQETYQKQFINYRLSQLREIIDEAQKKFQGCKDPAYIRTGKILEKLIRENNQKRPNRSLERAYSMHTITPWFIDHFIQAKNLKIYRIKNLIRHSTTLATFYLLHDFFTARYMSNTLNDVEHHSTAKDCVSLQHFVTQDNSLYHELVNHFDSHKDPVRTPLRVELQLEEPKKNPRTQQEPTLHPEPPQIAHSYTKRDLSRGKKMKHPSPQLSHSLEKYLAALNSPNYTPGQRNTVIERVQNTEWHTKNLSDGQTGTFFDHLCTMAEKSEIPPKKHLETLLRQIQQKRNN